MGAFFGEIRNSAVAFFCGPFVYASPLFCQQTGWEQNDLLGMDLSAIALPPFAPDREPVQAINLRHGVSNEAVAARLHLMETPSEAPGFGFVTLHEPAASSLLLDTRALHDLRNPLNTILGYGRIFQEDGQFPPRYSQAADAIVKAAETIRSGLGSGNTDETASPPETSGGTGTAEKVTILIVDDDSDNRDVLGLFLKKYPLTLLFANDGASAYAMALKEQPDLIFMDLHMPDMDGRDAARKIKKVLPDTRIAALTADVLAVEEEGGETRIFDRKLHKPFNRSELRETITALTGLALDRPKREETPAHPAANLPRPLLEAILANTKAGHITALEELIAGCREEEIRTFLLRCLEQFDLACISRWAEGGLTDGE